MSAWWFYSQRGDNVTNRLALLLVRDLRLLIAMRSDFPDDEHRGWILRHARSDMLLFITFRKGVVRQFQTPAYFDIVAREVQGALDADLKRPYYIDNAVGGEQLLIEIQLTSDDVMDVLVPYVRLTFGSSFACTGAARPRPGAVGLASGSCARELVPIEHLGVAATPSARAATYRLRLLRRTRRCATPPHLHTMRIRLRRSIQQRTGCWQVSATICAHRSHMKLAGAAAGRPRPRAGRRVTDMGDRGLRAFARRGDEERRRPTSARSCRT
jgi:two-component system osmolarity sensor histidine kinase EnvZ